MKALCAWLLVNLIRTEDVQAGLLGEQRLAHFFRQSSLAHLLHNHKRCGTSEARAQYAAHRPESRIPESTGARV